MRQLVSKSIYAKKDRNSPPNTNHGLSTTEPSHSHAVWIQMPPLVPPTPMDIAGSDIIKLL